MVLVMEDVYVQYGRSVMALQGASIEVDEGELVSLVGPNGAGKSTVLKAVMGWEPVHSGEVRVDGKSVDRRDYSPIDERIAYVPEDRGIFSRLSVGENLRLGAVTRRDKRQIEHDLQRELKRFPVLREFWGRGASLLSGGEQQQLAIARAMMLRPRLILLDEPTLGLAPLLVDKIFEVIEELRAEGATVLLVEQNAGRSIEVADRSYVLQTPGRVIGSGTGDELGRNEAVVEYLGFAPSSGPSEEA